MNLSQSNKRLQQLYQTIKKSTQTTKNTQILTNINQLLIKIFKQDNYITQQNNQIGKINLQPSVKRTLPTLIKSQYSTNISTGSIHRSNLRSQKQKIYVTKAYYNKYIPHSYKEQEEIQKDLKDSYKINDKYRKQESILLVYFKKNLYLLRQFKDKRNKEQFVIDKSILTNSSRIDLSNHHHLFLQPYAQFNAFKHKLQQKMPSILRKPNQPHQNPQNYLLNYIVLNKHIQQEYKQYKQFILDLYNNPTTSQQRKFQIYEFHSLLKTKIQQLNCIWHEKQSDFRIGIISEVLSTQKQFLNKKHLQEQIKPNFYIYHQFQQIQIQQDNKYFDIKLQLNNFKHQSTLKSLISSSSNGQKSHVYDGIRLIKQIILYQLIYQKNKQMLNNILTVQKRLQHQLYIKIIEQKKSQEKKKQQKQRRRKQGKSFLEYQNLNIKNFFIKWNQKIKSFNLKSKIPFLMVSLGDVFLIEDYKYIEMKCQVFVQDLGRQKNPYVSQKLAKYYTYEFDQNTEDWNVKLILKQDKNKLNNLNYNLAKIKDLFMVKVLLTPLLDKNKKSKNSVSIQPIEGNFIISKLQKLKSFGQNCQIVLNQQQSGNIVGFLDVFFLIKKQYDQSLMQNFNIQSYRNIKVLERIGKIPANYYEQLTIPYNPNILNLYAQLLGYNNQQNHSNNGHKKRPSKKTTPITQQNFQRMYIQLINFLQNERNSRRRTKMMTQSSKVQQMRMHKSVMKKSSSNQLLKKQQQFESHLHFYRQQRYEQYLDLLGISKARNLSKENRREKMNGSEQESNYNYKNNDLEDGNNTFIQQTYVYFQIPFASDEISYKTFDLISQNLKRSIYQSQKLLCPGIHRQTFEIISMLFSLNSDNVRQSIVTVYKDSKTAINSSKKHNIHSLQAFNPYLVPLINRIITLVKQKQDNLDDRKSSSPSVYSMNSQYTQSSYQTQLDTKQTIQFVVNFLHQLYPYFLPINLQKQILYIRYFVQKYLPQFNFKLNRLNIGLQNLITKYLLSLFSFDLQEQITFQIWDFIVLCPNKFFGRINCMITLLIFLEKTDLKPIIPVNSFINALYDNYKKFDYSSNANKIINQMLDSLGTLYEKQHQRKHALYKLRDQKGNLLVGGEFFKKIMFDTERLNKVTTANKPSNTYNSLGNMANLNSLQYKLPEPKYFGYPLEQIKLFIKGYSIYQTVSITQWNLVIKWHNSISSPILINQKSQILNNFVKFEYPKFFLQNSYNLQPIEFYLYPTINETQNNLKLPDKFLFGTFDILNLHKDLIYTQQVRLFYIKDKKIQLSNKGQNILNLNIILKSKRKQNHPQNSRNIQQNRTKQNDLFSSRFTNKSKYQQHNLLQATLNSTNLCLQKQYYKNQQIKQEKLYNSLLDYNLSEQENVGIQETANIIHTFNKMKNPIDQFMNEKYNLLKIPIYTEINFPEVCINSMLLIEHFHLLISETFTKEKVTKEAQSIYQTKISEIYQLFSKKTNNQMVFLTEILMESLLLDKTISLEQKVQYLYCLGKHYQNCGGKGLTIQTIDYIFDYAYKTYGWMNAVPYSEQRKGEIIRGTIYMKGIKVEQQALDISDILRDWAHICKIKYKHFGLFLGDSMYLSQLRALMPPSTLHTLQNQARKSSQSLCRIQIIYRKNSKQYIWAATINCSDFKIKNIGTKFLQKFPLSRQLNSGKVLIHDPSCKNFTNMKVFIQLDSIKTCTSKSCFQRISDLDTSSQVLYNCSNFISLQSNLSISKQQFKSAIYATPLLSYLLNFSSLYEPIQTIKSKPSKSDKFSKIGGDLQSVQLNNTPRRSNQINNQYGYRQKMRRQERQPQSILGSSSVYLKSFQNQYPSVYKYNDWLKHRYQNCIQQWLPCQILKIQNDIAFTLLKPQHLHQQLKISKKLLQITQQKPSINSSQSTSIYKIPSFQCWSMQQNLVLNDSKDQQNQSLFHKNQDKNISMQQIVKKYNKK